MIGSTQDPEQPQQLRADPEIATADQADDRVAPEDHDGDDEHEQENPLGAAEGKHGERLRLSCARAYLHATGTSAAHGEVRYDQYLEIF